MADLASVMECTVLSVAEDIFRAKQPGEVDRTMYRLYMADAKGRVGYLYSSKPHVAGDVVVLGLAERDGRLRLAVVG